MKPLQTGTAISFLFVEPADDFFSFKFIPNCVQGSDTFQKKEHHSGSCDRETVRTGLYGSRNLIIILLVFLNHPFVPPAAVFCTYSISVINLRFLTRLSRSEYKLKG